MKKTPLEMVWGECVGSLLLGNECAAVEVSVYFCRLSFQGPDWQLFLEPESHSLLNRLRREEREGGTHSRTHTHTKSIHTHTHWHSMLHMSVTHAWTPTLTHTCVQACSQPRLHVQSLFKLINKWDVFTQTHTHTHCYKHTHTSMSTCMCPNLSLI